MKKHTLILPVFLAAVVAFIFTVPTASAGHRHHRHRHHWEQAPPLEFEEAGVRIEFNSTDQDIGVQFFVDGEPWKKLTITGPDGDTIVEVDADGSAAQQGLTEWYYESGEPTLDEVPIEEFLTRFPEGTYVFEGKTTEGDKIEGEGEFTHVIPCGFEVGVEVNYTDETVTFTWDTPDQTVDPTTTEYDNVQCTGPAPEIELYQVIPEGTEDEDNEDIQYNLQVLGDVNKMVLPLALFPNGNYQFEVIAREASGNQTTSGDEFEIER